MSVHRYPLVAGNMSADFLEMNAASIYSPVELRLGQVVLVTLVNTDACG